MIVKFLRNPFLLKEFKRVLYLESQLNKTYGSINKPTNQFGQNTKYPANNANIVNSNEKQLKKENITVNDQPER